MTKEKTTRVVQLAGYLSTYKDFAHMHPEELVPLAEYCLGGIDKIPSDTLEAQDTDQSREREIETLRLQLVACGVAALQNTEESKKQRIGRDSPYWSASYGDVCNAVDREMKLRWRALALVESKKDEALREAKNLILSTAPYSLMIRDWLAKYGDLVKEKK